MLQEATSKISCRSGEENGQASFSRGHLFACRGGLTKWGFKSRLRFPIDRSYRGPRFNLRSHAAKSARLEHFSHGNHDIKSFANGCLKLDKEERVPSSVEEVSAAMN